MTVFLTPDLKPFFGGTYFPPDNALRPAGIFCSCCSKSTSFGKRVATI